jgi:hypothetical protein
VGWQLRAIIQIPQPELRTTVPQATEWQHVGNEINAAMIFARADFVNVHSEA